MQYPTIENENVSRDFIESFGGYNHNPKINDNELYDMKNLTSSHYPLLATRQKRGEIPSNKTDSNHPTANGMIFRSKFYYTYVNSGNLFIVEDGVSHQLKATDVSASIHRDIIPMGAYMIILPDKQYFNTANAGDYGYIESIIETQNGTSVTLQPCKSDGTTYAIDYVGDTQPSKVPDKFTWLDTSDGTPILKIYTASNAMWTSFSTTYIKITSAGIGTSFKEGDGIEISGITINGLVDLNATSVVKSVVDNNSIIVTGLSDTVEQVDIYTVGDKNELSNGNTRVICDYYLTNETGNNTIYVYCDSSLRANALRGKNIKIGKNNATVLANTMAGVRTEVFKRINVYDYDDYYYHPLSVREAVTSATKVCLNMSLGEVEDYIGRELSYGGTTYTIVNAGNESINGQSGSSAIWKGYFVLDRSITIGERVILFERTDKYYTTLTVSFDENSLEDGDTSLHVESGAKICTKQDITYSQAAPITIKREMPTMDFVIESKNRLWGCRYGTNKNGEFVNEIYCSKLGDFKNWSCYEGLSTDSYAASCGTDGEWTGAINYLGYPLFFKERYIHQVYGSYPAQYQINDTAARGVQKGSGKSLAIVNEVLFYKSPNGICAYSGSLPNDVSIAFGGIQYHDAVACGFNNKYYVTMLDNADNPVLFVYDTLYGIWHKEDNLSTTQLCATNDDIYYLSNNNIKSMFGTGSVTENQIQWEAISGIYGLSAIDKKYISRLNIRLSINVGSFVAVSIMYDSSGVWERMCRIEGHNIQPFTLPIKPKRCDHFRLKLEGEGEAKIYSISKTIEQGSDI